MAITPENLSYRFIAPIVPTEEDLNERAALFGSPIDMD
jgi:hypothetical protein